MLKRNLYSLLALAVFGIFAAGSTPEIMQQIESATSGGGGSASSGGGGGGNYDACVAYVEKYNGLSCIKNAGVTLPAADTCPKELDQSPVDMTAYYKCLADAAKCNGDIPDLMGAANCSM